MAAGLFSFSNKFLPKKIGTLFLLSILFLCGNGTYLRNFIWATPAGLWWDVTQKAPNSVRAQAIYGQSLLYIGHYDEAKQALETALKLDPTHEEASHNLSKLYIRFLHQPEKGLAVAQKAYELQPKRFISCMALGDAYFMTKQYKKAERYYKETIQRYYFFVPAWNNLAISQFHNDKHDAAIATLKKMLTLDPTFEAGVMNLARMYQKTGKAQSALTLLKTFTQKNKHALNALKLYNFFSELQRSPASAQGSTHDFNGQ